MIESVPEGAVQVTTRGEWREWLEKHHARSDGVWLITFKKHTGKSKIDYDAAVEEALCFGWVDSKGRTLDDLRSMLYFAPRRPGSGWSKSNKDRIARLLAANRMAPPGLAKVQAAQKDGSWTRLDSVEALEVPADLARALGAYPDATRNFSAFPRSARRRILEWITLAKKPDTRAKRIAETARLAQDDVRANQ
jgi:uncharacterized protein YdeI (YjbR/CyaY-like superfamily)